MCIKVFENCLRNLFGLIGCVVLVGAAAHAYAQDVKLADGNPPLTSRMTSRYARLMEWSLDVPFDARDRTAAEKQFVERWQMGDEKNIKGVLDSLAFEKNLSGASAAKKGESQPQIKQKLFETTESESTVALNSLLLGIYRKNQKADVHNAEDGAAGGAPGLSQR